MRFGFGLLCVAWLWVCLPLQMAWAKAPSGVELPAPGGCVGRHCKLPPKKTRKWLRTMGWCIFAGGYFMSVLSGLLLLSEPNTICDRGKDACLRGVGLYLIPAIGPLMVIPEYRDNSERVPAALFLIMQVTGLSMALAGHTLEGRAKKRPPKPQKRAPSGPVWVSGRVLLSAR